MSSSLSDMNNRNDIDDSQERGMAMNRSHHRKTMGIFALIASVSLIFIAGCAEMSGGRDGFPGQTRNREKLPAYHDFNDVLIPPGYKLDKKSTFVFQTPGFSAGVLVFRGKIRLSPLIRFFNENMGEDNWRLISSFKSPRTLLIYNKENRWCVINISTGDSKVEIWLAPTMENILKKNNPGPLSGESRKMKGEPASEDFDSGLFKK
jgi:hypothetical protein